VSFTVRHVSTPVSLTPTAVLRDGVTAPRDRPRSCVRPACGGQATHTLRFDYAARTVALDPLAARAIPGEYDLCAQHAARTSPPSGWTLRDRAPSRATATEPAPPVGPERGPVVGRLAAALSAVPVIVSEDVPDAVPVGADRSVPHSHPHAPSPTPTPAPSPSPAPRGADRLDALLRGQRQESTAGPTPTPVAAPSTSELPHTRTLRLAPDPIASAWCADLLAPRAETAVVATPMSASVPVRHGSAHGSAHGPSGGPLTLFG